MHYARFIFMTIALVIPAVAHAQPAKETPVATTEAATEAPKPETKAELVTVPDAEIDPTGFAELLYKSVKGGNWALAAALAVIGLVSLIRKYGEVLSERVKALSWLKIFTTDRGGAALALSLGVAGGVANALLAGTMDAHTLLMGVEVGIMAAGGFTVVKKLLWPKDMPNAGLAPVK